MASPNDMLQTYEWDSPSFITHVDIRDHAKGRPVAYLYAPAAEGSATEKLHDIRETMTQKGWHTSSDIRHGQSVLRVTGFKSKDDFLKMLNENGLVHGDPTAGAVERDKPKNFIEKIKEHSLRASGIVYSIGNSLYVVNGIKRKKDIGQIGTGLAFASGDVAVAVFGGKDDQRQFRSLMTKLAKHLKKNGVNIPADTAFAAEISTKGENLGERVYDFMHRNIDKIKALAEVIGGGFYFKAGLDQNSKDKMLCSVIFGTGFGTSALIKEKKTDPEELKHAGLVKKAWAFWQESPLRVAGWSGYSNTILTVKHGLRERREEKNGEKPVLNAWPIDLATAGTMGIANGLYAASHKSGGGKITSGTLIDDVYGLTAQVLNRLPDDKREKGIKAAAQFLGDRIELPDFRKQAEVKLREHIVHASHKNPWFIGAGKPLSDSAAQDIAPAQTLLAAPEKSENWADYVARSGQAVASPAM